MAVVELEVYARIKCLNMKALRHPRRTALLGFACASVTWAAVWSATAAEVAYPPQHGQWEPFPVPIDEFDGDRLNESKWFPNNPGWLGRQPGYFNPQNVRAPGWETGIEGRVERGSSGCARMDLAVLA